MAWARIDDNFFNHPKVRKAGKDAVIFHMAALCHCNSFTTDGFISDDTLELIAAQAFQRKANGLAEVLVECELWDRIEGGYQIHDYLEYNYSKQQVDEIKTKRSEAGKQGGRPRVTKPKANEKQIESKLQANSKQIESHTHTHINPIPITDNNPTNLSSSIAEKSDDDDVYSGFKAIAEVTPQIKKQIDQAILTYGESMVKNAIAEGISRGANTFAYVAKILASQSTKRTGKPVTTNTPDKFREYAQKAAQ